MCFVYRHVVFNGICAILKGRGNDVLVIHSSTSTSAALTDYSLTGIFSSSFYYILQRLPLQLLPIIR